MAGSSKDWSRSRTGTVWVPGPTRRTLVSGVTAGATALFLGCGDKQKAAGNLAGQGGSSTGAGGAGGNAGSGGAAGGAGGGSAGAGGMDAGAAGGASGGGVDADSMPGPDGAMATGDAGNQVELACTKRSEQIVGPFPAADVQLDRADIRSDPGDNNLVKPGVPLRVVIRVGSKSGASCLPMKGAVVNAWQCDATGLYASYASQGTGKNQFLRGYQVTDGSGVVEFQTIYPGSYAGRCVHFHFSVRMNPSASFPSGGFVGQLYFPDEVTDQVLAQAPYSAQNRTKNAQDSFYAKDMLGTVSRLGNGWLAELELGV